MDVLSARSLGLPKLSIMKNWSLVFLNTYLIFSLNFIGIFGQETPPRIQSDSTFHQRGGHNFNASPYDSFTGRQPLYEPGHSRPHLPSPLPQVQNRNDVLPPPPSTEIVDTIDLSSLKKSGNPRTTLRKLVENSIDRFDAYGDYDYIEKDEHPQVAEFHRPQQSRPWGHPLPRPRRPPPPPRNQPSRRVDSFRPSNPHQQQRPHRPQRPHHHHHRQPQFHPQQHSHQQHFHHQPQPIPIHGVPGNYPGQQTGGVLGILGLDKNDAGSASAPVSSVFDPLLALVGLRDEHVPPHLRPDQLDHVDVSAEHLQYHDPYDYDYGEYVEGYPNLVRPPRKKSIPERIALWFTGFKLPSGQSNNVRGPPKFERFESGEQQFLDYTQYETGEDGNLIFHNQQALQHLENSNSHHFDFGDVLQAIRNNASSAEVAKKFLSAAAALSDRSDSNPIFMMWTIPTTIFALLGAVYFVGAISILGYKYMLDGSGDASAILPVAIVFTLPIILGFIFVTTRSSINGDLDFGRVMRGDISSAMRQDFDGVDFVMDALFGSSALLGVGWLISVTL